MRKFWMILTALPLAAGLSTTALAASSDGPGYQMGYGWSQPTPEQQAEAQKAHSEFLNQTLPLRQNLAAKRAELQTLYALPAPDPGKIRALSDELVDLSAQLAKKRNELAAKYPNSYGQGMMGRGYGGGRYGGMMGGGGYGHGYGGMMGGGGYGGMMGGDGGY